MRAKQYHKTKPTLPRLGLFCSKTIPGDLLLGTFDAIAALRDHGVTVIGGFHSPMEKECLTMLLRGQQQVIVCPARSIEGYRYPKDWKQPIAEGRLILLSDFPTDVRRVTTQTAEQRNRFVASQCNAAFIPYAAPASETLALAQEMIQAGTPLYTLPGPRNERLMTLGASDIATLLKACAT